MITFNFEEIHEFNLKKTFGKNYKLTGCLYSLFYSRYLDNFPNSMYLYITPIFYYFIRKSLIHSAIMYFYSAAFYFWYYHINNYINRMNSMQLLQNINVNNDRINEM